MVVERSTLGQVGLHSVSERLVDLAGGTGRRHILHDMHFAGLLRVAPGAVATSSPLITNSPVRQCPARQAPAGGDFASHGKGRQQQGNHIKRA